MKEEILEKFFSNRCSQEELGEFAKWLQKEGDTYSSQILFRKYWDRLYPDKNIPELSEKGLLDSVHHLLNLKMNTVSQLSGQSNSSFSRRLITSLYQVAAVLFIPLLLTALFFYSQSRKETVPAVHALAEPVYQEVYSPMGSRTRIELPDGSHVWLNNGSSIRFPLEFTYKQRLVLLSGEGYFEVEADTSRPFLVRTGKFQVRATGTVFNIMAYKDEDIIYTTLQSGKVSLEKVIGENLTIKIMELDPEEQARYSLTKNSVDYSNVDPANYMSWKDGKLVMKDDPLNEIIKKIGRWYNVDIELENQVMGLIKYSGTFSNETLTQVLDLMKLAAPIEYRIYPRIMQPDNTYSRKHILISLKKGYAIKPISNI